MRAARGACVMHAAPGRVLLTQSPVDGTTPHLTFRHRIASSRKAPMSGSRPTSRSRSFRSLWLSPLLTGLLLAGAAHAQQPPPGAAAPAPSWQQGRGAANEKSTLHPFAPLLTGRPAAE